MGFCTMTLEGIFATAVKAEIGTTYSVLTEVQPPQPIVYMPESCVSTIGTSDAVVVIDTWRCV